MNKAHFIKLLHKYLQGNATKAEQQFLFSYYDLFDAEPDVEVLLSKEQKEALKIQIKNDIWQSISLYEQQDQKVKPMYKKWLTVVTAAVLILGVFTASILFFINQPQEQTNTVIMADQYKENQLVRLSDGSTVIVSAGSKLKYSPSFDGFATREIYLEGQAYFDIKHHTAKPFIVHVGNLKTTVLGTAFNIKAFPTDADVAVTVTRGKVKVGDQHHTLSTVVQDQRLTYVKENAKVFKQVIDTDDDLAWWREQDLLLDDITLPEANELLEEKFGVRITCSNELIRSKRFTITILKSESLEQVLKSICEFNNSVYHYDKEKASVIISSKK